MRGPLQKWLEVRPHLSTSKGIKRHKSFPPLFRDSIREKPVISRRGIFYPITRPLKKRGGCSAAPMVVVHQAKRRLFLLFDSNESFDNCKLSPLLF
jgi:hypothetical protein